MSQLPVTIIAIGLIAAMIAVAASFVRFRLAAYIVTAMVVFASIAVQREDNLVVNSTFIQPIQLLRAELFMAAAVVLLVACLANGPKLRWIAPAQAVAFLVIHMYAGTLRLVHEGSPSEGAKSIAFAIIGFVPLMLVVPPMLADREGWYVLLRALVLAGAIWCFLVLIQLGISRRELMVDYGRRLAGMHGQSQAASQYLCFISTISVWLFINDPKRSIRMWWLVVSAVSLVFIAWTGSRSGAIMALIGLAFVLYARAGRAILLLPVMGAVVLVAYSLLTSDIQNVGSRLLDMTDTRSVVWRQMIDQFLADPLFGSGTKKAVENSYLLGLAAYGIFMGVLMLILLGVTASLMRRLWRVRRVLSYEYRQWVWLILGVNAMYFIGANADGFMLARLEATHVIILIFAGYGTLLARMTTGDWVLDEVSSPFADDADSDEAYGAESLVDAGYGRQPTDQGEAELA